MSKYLELAKKLKALTERGEVGEKYNAEVHLKRLMKAHSFTLDDIEDERKDHHYFKCNAEYVWLFGQVAATVCGNGTSLLRDRNRKGYVVIETTASNAVELECKFSFFKSAYDSEIDIFKSVFIATNNLYPTDGIIKSGEDLSLKEKERIKKISRMAIGMQAQQYLKQLK